MEIHLASMENITCFAFRSLMQGVTDSYTGMISMGYLIERHKAWKEVDMFPIEGQKQWLQVLTSREKEVSDFFKRMDEKLVENKLSGSLDGLYGIQLNCSCPSPIIIKVGQGSALIKRPGRVVDLVHGLLKQDKFKVSIKTRLGLNEFEVKEGRIFKLFDELEKIKDPNFTEVVVHFRHAKEKSTGSYDYSCLKELCDYNIPIVINGGIKNYRDFNNIVKTIPKRKNIKGLMIGREALVNPDCFVGISNMLNCTLLKERSLDEVNKDFKKLCEEHVPRDIYLNRIKSSCTWNK